MCSEVDIGLFKECANMMKFDDFIHTENMDSKKAMHALDVDKPRIDCHVMAKGMYTASDAIKSPDFVIPDENATKEQILDITGYYIDCLASRLNGYTAYQSTLLSVYIHKEYEFKNPLIEIVSMAFLACFSEIENYVNNVIGGSTSTWLECTDMGVFCHDYDIEAIRGQFEKTVIGDELVDYKNTVKFVLDFADFLKSYPNKPVPEITTLVGRSAPLGFTQSIHYRDLSTTAPPFKIQITDHETSLQSVRNTIESLKEINEMPECTSMREIIVQAISWSNHHKETPIFDRIFFYGSIFNKDEHIYGQHVTEFLKKELKYYHTPDQLEAHSEFKSISSYLNIVLRQITRALLSPTAFAQCTLQAYIPKCWSTAVSFMVNFERTNSRPRPKTKQPTVEAILKSTLANWAGGITGALGLAYLKLFVDSEIMVNDDILFIGQLFHCSHLQIYESMKRQREVDAAYAVFAHRGGKSSVVLTSADIDRKLSPPSADELTEKALVALGNAIFYAGKYCLSRGSIPKKEAMFYSQSAAYESRIAPVIQLGLALPGRSAFEAAMSTPAEFFEAKRFFDEARTLAAKAAQMDPTDARKAFVKSIIVSSMTVTSKDKVKVVYENNIPSFISA